MIVRHSSAAKPICRRSRLGPWRKTGSKKMVFPCVGGCAAAGLERSAIRCSADFHIFVSYWQPVCQRQGGCPSRTGPWRSGTHPQIPATATGPTANGEKNAPRRAHKVALCSTTDARIHPPGAVCRRCTDVDRRHRPTAASCGNLFFRIAQYGPSALGPGSRLVPQPTRPACIGGRAGP